MTLFAEIVDHLIAVLIVGLVSRACWKLIQNPEKNHRELVPAWERRVTTVVGVPLLLVGLSTMVDGPLAVSFNALTLTLLGAVLSAYPDFTPSGAA
ncbi:hypothetical protein [Haladaptatus sp. NG-SE-30]